jgi:hypothetical protein
MPQFHSSELQDMSDMQRKEALDAVYEAALENQHLLERLQLFSSRGGGTAPTPTQTSPDISLERERIEFAKDSNVSSL